MPKSIPQHRPRPKAKSTPGRNLKRTIPLNTAAWQRLRAAVLAERPLCAHCFERGRVVLATDVDHADEDPSNNLRSNLVSLCHSCHSTKTARVRHGSAPVYGCDIRGMPADPAHPWNEENRQQPTALDRAPRLAHAAAKVTGGSEA